MTMTTCNTCTRPVTKQSPSVLRVLSLALAAYRQRLALRRLDDAALNDIGLSRYEAKIEANRSFWDVPASWRR